MKGDLATRRRTPAPSCPGSLAQQSLRLHGPKERWHLHGVLRDLCDAVPDAVPVGRDLPEPGTLPPQAPASDWGGSKFFSPSKDLFYPQAASSPVCRSSREVFVKHRAGRSFSPCTSMGRFFLQTFLDELMVAVPWWSLGQAR